MNAKRALLGSWSTTALACLGIALPKCPLCLAAYLCLFGLSASSARAVATLGLPICVTFVALSALATALFVARRGRRVAASSEGSGGMRSEPACCALRAAKLDAEG